MRYFSSILVLLTFACNPAPKHPDFSGRGSGDLSRLPKSGPLELTVEVSSERFQDYLNQDISYQVQFSGRQEQGVINFSQGNDKIKLEEVPSSGDLYISFVADGKEIFTAEKTKLTFKSSTSTNYKLASCRIVPVKWSGKQNIGTCNWTLNEK